MQLFRAYISSLVMEPHHKCLFRPCRAHHASPFDFVQHERMCKYSNGNLAFDSMYCAWKISLHDHWTSQKICGRIKVRILEGDVCPNIGTVKDPEVVKTGPDSVTVKEGDGKADVVEPAGLGIRTDGYSFQTRECAKSFMNDPWSMECIIFR